MTLSGLPPKQGLYDPRFEHDACGVGFVVHIKGEKSHEIVEQALTVLENLDHRGACGCEENTGDGAGILLQIPHAFLKDACGGLGFQLPDPGEYGVGMIFLPDQRDQRRRFEKKIEEIIADTGQKLLGWRKVPTDNMYLGDTAKEFEPFVRQVFIGRGEGVERRPGVRAQTLRDSPAGGKCDSLCGSRRRGFFLRSEHVLPHAHLQRHADAAPGERRFIPIFPIL